MGGNKAEKEEMNVGGLVKACTEGSEETSLRSCLLSQDVKRGNELHRPQRSFGGKPRRQSKRRAQMSCGVVCSVCLKNSKECCWLVSASE